MNGIRALSFLLVFLLAAVRAFAQEVPGAWLQLGRDQQPVQVPLQAGDRRFHDAIPSWQVGVGCHWLDVGDLGLHWGLYEFPRVASEWSGQSLELRFRTAAGLGILHPVLGLGWGALRKNPPSFPAAQLVDRGFEAKGPLFSLGLDAQLDLYPALALLVGASHRWSRLGTDWIELDIAEERDTRAEGWYFGAQLRLRFRGARGGIVTSGLTPSTPLRPKCEYFRCTE